MLQRKHIQRRKKQAYGSNTADQPDWQSQSEDNTALPDNVDSCPG